MNKFRRLYTPDLISSHPINLSVEKRGEGDTNEKLIKSFLRKCKKFRLLDEMKRHDHYVKPSIQRRLDKEKGIRNTRRRERDKAKLEENAS
jgi:ribosomal protein S21